MKKTSMVTKVMVTLIAFAATLTISSCNKIEGLDEFQNDLPELNNIDSVKIAHQRYLEEESEYANGEIRFVCLDSIWAFMGGIAHPGTAHCVCTWAVNPAEDVRNLDDTCMAISATQDPRNLIFGANRTVVTLLTAEIRDAIVAIDGIEYSVKSTLMSQGHTCIATPYRLCTNGAEVTFWGRGDDGDTVPATGDRGNTTYIHDTTTRTDTVTRIDTVYVHDTVRVIQVDTIWQHDTTRVNDTVFIHDTIIGVDSTVVDLVHTSSYAGSRVSDSLKYRCLNAQVTRVFRNGNLVSQNSQNFYGWFTHKWTVSGSISSSQIGMKVRVNSSGVANFGGGLSITIGAKHKYAQPSTYFSQLIQLGCDHNVDSVLVLNTTTLQIIGHYDDGTRTTVNVPAPTNTPTVTATDTLWGTCTTANAWYQATPTEQVKATVGKTYRLVRTWSDSHTDTIAGGTATTTYVWNVVRTGQPTSAMASTLPVNGNPASFGGGAFTEALNQVGTQRFCPAVWTSATLTSSTATTGTTTWTGTYGTTTMSVTVPETLTIDTSINIPGQILFVGVTLSVQNDITPGMVTPEYFVNVVYSAGGTVHHRLAPLVGFHSGATFTDATVSATVAQIQSYVTNGQYPAKCYNHVTQNYVLGTVNEVISGSAWVIQWFSYTNRSTHYNTINSISNVFVDGEHPAIILGSFITSDGTITINGVSYTFTGSSL